METALIYAGIPLAVILVIYGLVYAGGVRRSRRYRPGRSFEFRPVWFLSAPGADGPYGRRPGAAGSALAAGDAPAALPAGDGGPPAGTARGSTGTTGGASDSW